MAPPKLLEDLRKHVESTQATYTDPAERDRALSVIETDLTNLLGVVKTYRNDARLQAEGEQTGDRDGDQGGSGKAPQGTPPSAESS